VKAKGEKEPQWNQTHSNWEDRTSEEVAAQEKRDKDLKADEKPDTMKYSNVFDNYLTDKVAACPIKSCDLVKKDADDVITKFVSEDVKTFQVGDNGAH